MVRVAVLQIERSPAPEHSLAACIAQIERAVLQHRADILVCPELSFDASDPSTSATQLATFRESVQERARLHGVWIGLSLLFGASSFSGWLGPEAEPQGEGPTSDRTLVTTAHGKVGLCAGQSVLQTAPARELALSGALLICAPAAACSASRAALHLSARALENRLFVALAACFERTSQTYPADSVTLPPPADSAAQGVRGATSQILGPNGRPLAVAVVEEPGVAVAELDLGESAQWGDSEQGSLWELRRPELYRPAGRERRPAIDVQRAELSVATVDVSFRAASALAAAVEKLEVLRLEQVELVVLPELFHLEPGPSEAEAEAAANGFIDVVRALTGACRGSGMHVVTSLVERVCGELTHVGVVIGQAGIVARQLQLHVPRRYAWARAGRRLENIRMPWGNLALAVGEDALMPELASSYAAIGTTLLAAPLSSHLHAEGRIMLPALADQLQMAIVAALPSDREADEQGPAASLIVDARLWPAPKLLADAGICRAMLSLRAPSAGFAARKPSALSEATG